MLRIYLLEAHAYVLEIFKKLRTGNGWLPPSFQGTLWNFPGWTAVRIGVAAHSIQLPGGFTLILTTSHG